MEEGTEGVMTDAVIMEEATNNYNSVAQDSYPMTSDDSGPSCSFRPEFGFFGVYCGFMVLWLAMMIFMIVMIYKFVRATERIAKVFENGITIKKTDSDV